MYTGTPTPPRHPRIIRVFDDRIELNWILPRERKGLIRHYIVKYTTQDGTQREFNTGNNLLHCNLSGLERGRTYNITVAAVNSAGRGRESQPISYVHNPPVKSTSELELEVLRMLSGCQL